MDRATQVTIAVANVVLAICAVMTLLDRPWGQGATYLTTEGTSASAGAVPWWAVAVAVAAVIALIVNVGARLVRRRSVRAFPTEFLTKLERLCADEHEIALRTQIPFPAPDVITYRPKRLERRDYFRGIVAALEAPCIQLGLTQTLPKINEALRRLKEDRSNGDGYALFHDVSQSLKAELEDKWRLMRAL